MTTTTTPITAEQAVTAYPELEHFARLIAAAPSSPVWKFAAVSNGAGVITGLVGVRVWAEGTRDVIGINSRTQARVVRTNPWGERVFERIDTVAALLDIVADRLGNPGHPLAPRLEMPRQVAGYTTAVPPLALR